ncbi:gephyrin-like molybdotransferase Glp [Microbacterium sp. SORGH_AS_0888]|uniref:molybdopterin molybdotransferase MoeA n=1 Tax=Microbacterium sp. SORGH_AS_0888 TaxID=3041791 RepID=UPI0027D7860D|nr:gephyrin-like molybdotransferase Glp [Microbacterium sp. SORGH_AS_0888]
MSPLATVEDHLAHVLDAVRPLPAETVDTADARGRVLVEPAHAAIDLPPFDNSAMDGFAVRAADVAGATLAAPVRLTVAGDLPAGTAEDPPLSPGQAIRIMTGAPMPAMADAIVPFEDTLGGLADSLGEIAVTAAPVVGAHRRRRGEDTRRGDAVLAAGVRLGPLQLGALAAAGVARLTVSQRPRVVVVATGSELVPLGEPLRRGQIPESNGTMLAALAAEAGAFVVRRESVDDEGSALASLLAEVTTGEDAADAVVFSGGVSAGAYEVVRTTVSQMRFGGVAMQPGKPQGFGVAGRTLLFGLPGNPVSSAVSFEVFVRPALLAMQGATELRRRRLRLPAGAGWRTPPGRRQYLPIVIDRTDPAAWKAVPASSGGSHLAGRLGGAEAYAIVPAEVTAVSAGDLVDVMLLD